MADVNFVVESRVRDHLRNLGGEKQVRLSDEFMAAINAKVAEMLNTAVTRATGNGRATLKANDL